MSATSDFDAHNGRTLPTVVYVLYLLGLINGLTVLIGVILAYANSGRSGPVADNHYRFQIRTFWIGLLGWMIAAVLLFWGVPLSLILIGVPLVMLAGVLIAATHIWFAVRCILGLMYLARGEPYPRPAAWLA